ncbi:MAG: metallophosphoesterase, partial [Clostridia bacterium]
MRKSMSLLLVTALLLSLFAFPLASASAEPVEIVVFHTNDVHARVLPDPGMGYAMAAGYVDAARSAGKNVLLLDAGDTFHGLVIATAVRGESIVNIMNAMKYDAMAPGNHDFNYGLDRLQELSTLAEFPLLSCNVLGKDGKSIFAPYAI